MAYPRKLDSLADQFNIKLTGESINEKFFQLIEILAADKKVVVLVDEYDNFFYSQFFR
ncbi:MAG: hypothetical protein MUF15_23330 [Acidobacteria bacterium]|jgi:5S rRNA maturation endonuclease (ribonuclease M5)|nr:hypothetical protein [Acidobacteriota bacterium]